MSNNYFIFHSHTDYSNLNTTMDSVTKVEHYIDRVKEEGMKGICFSEHGNLHDWVDKKLKVEKAGLKYIHGVEAYVTKTLDERVRDNYHVVLIAKNYEGVEEINYLMSDKVANNRDDGHFYYTPRITFDELINTSDNVIQSSACLGSILNSDDIELQKEYIRFMAENKDRCFLEIQHHNVEDQKLYNKKLLKISEKTGIRLIAGTDTHNLNEKYAEGREVLQKSKFIHFDNEDGWDLNFKSREELEDAYKEQGSLSKEVYIEAINNTNVLFDMVEEFELDYSYKYPELYDNSEEVLKEKIAKNIIEKDIELTEEVSERINEEFETMRKNHAIDYMLLEEDYKSYCREVGIPYGFGRGCFTKDAIIVTDETMKPINEIEIGDKVVSDDGKFHKVLNTFEYDVKEDLVEFQYFTQGSSYNKYKNICTEDHKVLVKRGGEPEYIEAKDLKVGDLLCSPKIRVDEQPNKIIDLVKYNNGNYDYDDGYIYETSYTKEAYKYSPRWFERKSIDINHTWLKRYAYSDVEIVKRQGKENERLFFENTPFKTREDYRRYCKGKSEVIKKIPRYIEMDYLWNVFIGLMYGDGCVRDVDKNKNEIGIAINKTSKSVFNRRVFESIAKRLNLDITENSSTNSNLVQLYMHSEVVANWIREEYFVSKRGRDKYVPSELLNQSRSNLEWFYKGLLRSDGSVNEKDNKMSFDNTSLSLMNAFKLLNNLLGYEPMALDYRAGRVDERGWNNQDSYKARRPIDRKRNIIKNDADYWYLPVTKIWTHKDIKTKVYDLHVEGNHSYMINNIIVHNSVTGSFLAYLLDITAMDSIKHDLNFSRFMNDERVSLCDVDSDFPPEQRDMVKDYLYNKEGLYCADIITFNTIAKRGAIRDVGRALEIPLDVVNNISSNIESNENGFREEYPELFKYVDLLQGVIVSMGTHAAGVVVSPIPLEEFIGTCRLKTSDNPVTQINMNSVEKINLVKLDILGLDMISIIDQATKMAGLDPITPDSIDTNDEAVWKDMLKSTFGIFQWNTSSGEPYYQQLFSKETISKLKAVQGDDFDYMNLFSMGNGAIRPAGNSYRDALARGEFRDNGHQVLNEFLRPTLGFLIFQEQIMDFLHEFCGFTMGEADVVRRSFSNKSGTNQYTPRIVKGFVETMDKEYNICKEEAEELIVDFIKVIEDASDYLFNKNHSHSYSYTGYVSGWLRYYYPLEYLAAFLNVNNHKQSKTADAFNFMYEFTDIEVVPIKFRYSRAEYNIDKEENLIYKGIESIKYMNSIIADELYELRGREYNSFVDLLVDIAEETSCNTRQMKILIELSFFSEFGGIQKLLDIYDEFQNGKVRYRKTHIDKTKETRRAKLNEFENTVEDIDYSPIQKVRCELEHLGYAETTVKGIDSDIGIVARLEKNQWGTVFIDLYRLNNGEIDELKITRRVYEKTPIEELDTIKTISIENKNKVRKVDSEWIELDETEDILTRWRKVVE